jgi:hypothetical protein
MSLFESKNQHELLHESNSRSSLHHPKKGGVHVRMSLSVETCVFNMAELQRMSSEEFDQDRNYGFECARSSTYGWSAIDSGFDAWCPSSWSFDPFPKVQVASHMNFFESMCSKSEMRTTMAARSNQALGRWSQNDNTYAKCLSSRSKSSVGPRDRAERRLPVMHVLSACEGPFINSVFCFPDFQKKQEIAHDSAAF